MSELNVIGLIAFSAVLMGTPGPAVISLLYSGINYGFKRSLPFLFGITLGFFGNLVLSALGVGVVLANEAIFTVLKFALLGYIFYLAYKIATSPPLGENDASTPLSFYQGVLLNLLNPKAYVACISAISQFSVAENYWPSVRWIVLINLTLAFILQGSWCYVGGFLKRLFSHPKWSGWANRALAVVLVLSVLWSYVQ